MTGCGLPGRFASLIDNRAEAQQHNVDKVPAVDRWAPRDFCMEYLGRVESSELPAGGPRPTFQQARLAYDSTREVWNESVRLGEVMLGTTAIRSELEAAPFWLRAGAEVDDRAQARDSVRTDTAPRCSKGRARSRS